MAPYHYTRYFFAPFRLFGLTGTDGWPSFSKLITFAVVISYLANRAIPESVAVVVVVAANGTKAIVEFIRARYGTSPSIFSSGTSK